MTSRLMLLAGAAALVMAGAAAEPPHGQNCPPGVQHCDHGPQGGQMGHDNHNSHDNHGGAAMVGGQGWHGGPGDNKSGDWQWKDDRGGWHRDHDRYWRPDFRGGFASRDRLFSVLRQHSYNRWDGDPYWFQGHFVIKTFDRFGSPVIVELNPYTGDFIGIIRF